MSSVLEITLRDELSQERREQRAQLWEELEQDRKKRKQLRGQKRNDQSLDLSKRASLRRARQEELAQRGEERQMMRSQKPSSRQCPSTTVKRPKVAAMRWKDHSLVIELARSLGFETQW